MPAYLAAFRKNGNYHAAFPDFPECLAQGSSLREAIEDARSRLAGQVERLAAAGRPLPAPSDLHDLAGQEEWRNVLAFIVIEPREAMQPPAARIELMLPQPLLHAIDSAARGHGMERGAYIVRALEQMLKAPREAENR